MEFLTYSVDNGFNILDVADEQSAEMLSGQESICLGVVSEFDDIILKRIRELLGKEKTAIDYELIALSRMTGEQIINELNEDERAEYEKFLE